MPAISSGEPPLAPRPPTDHLPHILLSTGASLGSPPEGKTSTALPTFGPPAGSQSAGLTEAWAKLIEEHVLSRKPSKQVFVGSGLPVLPKRLVDKMVAGEYINFNELIPFCDPSAEEQSSAAPEHYLFPSLGLIKQGHKVEYSFLQWASCFVTYMAVLSSKGSNITHMCAYFNTILKASREYTDDMWRHYDADYRQKAEATHNTDWSSIDSALFNQCFTGRAKKVQRCTTCNSAKHDTSSCPRKKGKRPMSLPDDALPSPKLSKQRPEVCYNFNYHRACSRPEKAEVTCAACGPKHDVVECRGLLFPYGSQL